MEPLLLFALPILLLFAVQGSEFSVPAGSLTTVGLLAPLVLRPGYLLRVPFLRFWMGIACVSRLALFAHLQTFGWDELSTMQGVIIAIAGISGALAAADSRLPAWTARSVIWPLLAAALLGFVFPFIPALPFAIGGLLWIGPLLWSGSRPDERSIEMREALLASCLLGIAIGFPVLDGSLLGDPATGVLALAFVSAALFPKLPRIVDVGALDLLPPLLVVGVLAFPQVTLWLVWPIAVGIGMGRILTRPHESRTVIPAATFIVGVAIAHAYVSQPRAVYAVIALVLAEVVRILLGYRKACQGSG